MRVTFHTERFCDIWDDIQPLLMRHWNEIACKDICGPLEVNANAYRILDENGVLHITTARVNTAQPDTALRENATLIGYAAYIVSPNLHYSQRIMAEADVFYLAPEYRRGTLGVRLLKAAEAALITRGAHIVVNKVKLTHNIGALFARMGYEHVENVWMKAV